MAKKPRRKKGEPKPVKVPEDRLRAVLKLNPSLIDTAGYFDVSEDTIERACHKYGNCTFAEFRERNMSHTRLRLAKKALDLADQGVMEALKICLKNINKWTDRVDLSGRVKVDEDIKVTETVQVEHNVRMGQSIFTAEQVQDALRKEKFLEYHLKQTEVRDVTERRGAGGGETSAGKVDTREDGRAAQGPVDSGHENDQGVHGKRDSSESAPGPDHSGPASPVVGASAADGGDRDLEAMFDSGSAPIMGRVVEDTVNGTVHFSPDGSSLESQRSAQRPVKFIDPEPEEPIGDGEGTYQDEDELY